MSDPHRPTTASLSGETVHSSGRTSDSATTGKTGEDAILPVQSRVSATTAHTGVKSTIEPLQKVGTAVTLHNGKRVLREEDAFEKLAYAWSDRKKWTLLTVVAICQTSESAFYLSRGIMGWMLWLGSGTSYRRHSPSHFYQFNPLMGLGMLTCVDRYELQCCHLFQCRWSD
jgi:hypothetical protein